MQTCKKETLEKIAREIEKCRVCKEGKIGKAVPGEGNPDAAIVFLGEAPGKQEAKTGRPFIGRSGKLLRSLISQSGLKDDDVYITSPVKYLPLRGTPTRKDITHGKNHLNKQLAVIRPKIIVLLGNTAIYAIFSKALPIVKNHGRIIEEHGRKYFLTFHPAAALRFPPIRKELEKDFKKLKEVILPN